MARPGRLEPAAFALVERARDTLLRHRMVRPEETVLVGVSGGPDSTCLLDVLQRVPFDLDLVVAHVDHGLSENSEKIAARVAAEASTTGLDVHLARASDLEGPNLQARARDFRYEFFRIVAEQTGASKIATGHTLDDLAETTLARLIHGGATEVLAGIRPVDGDRIRPLLDIRRAETRAYCEVTKLAFSDDPANDDERFERTFVRHSLVSLIEDRYGEGAIRAIATTAARLREDAGALGFLADRLYKEIASEDEDGVTLNRETLLALPRGLRRRLIELAVGHARDRSGGIEAALDALDGAEEFASEKRFSVAAGFEIAIDRQRVLVCKMPR